MDKQQRRHPDPADDQADEQAVPQGPGQQAPTPPLDTVVHAPAPSRSRNPYLVPLTVAATAGVVALVMALGPPVAGAPTPATTVTVTATAGSGSGGGTTAGSGQVKDTARRTAGDPLALGRSDAPVVLVEYSDFSCPYCAAFSSTTEPALVQKYVDSGVLRIEWRDFPYLTSQSGVAAIAARAAGRQGEFWEMHDALFTTMHAQGFDKLSPATLQGLAEKLGLDVTRFMTDFATQKVADEVAADLGEGTNLGVTGTPTFVVNGTLVVGAQPEAVFAQVIEQAAAVAQ
jgi:protein-disulfide isomerase